MNPTPAPGRPAGDPFVAIDADLDLLATLTPAEQVAAYGRIHGALSDALAATSSAGDTGPQAPAGGR